MCRAILQKDVRKAAGRRAKVHRHHAGGIVGKDLQSLFKLERSAGYITRAGLADDQFILRLHRRGRLGYLIFSDIDHAGHHQRLRLFAA